VKASADGDGVVSHAGAALLREAAPQRTGLVAGVIAALADTCQGLRACRERRPRWAATSAGTATGFHDLPPGVRGANLGGAGHVRQVVLSPEISWARLD
jgi:hypothetical protein